MDTHLYFCNCIHIHISILCKNLFIVACQDGAHTSHTTIADFKGIFIKYLFEFMTFWEIPPNLSEELLSNTAFYVVRIWQIKPGINYYLLPSFLFFITSFSIFKFFVKSIFMELTP